MPKTVSSTEAKVKLGSIMDWAVDNQDEVVIESRGKPRAVIISFDEYTALKRLKAYLQLEEVARKVQAQNTNLSAEEAEKLADDVSRKAIGSLVAKGKVQFQSS